MRIEIEADLEEFVPLKCADLMVAYGLVEIGGKTYCGCVLTITRGFSTL
jgi:hypothetical protein